MGEGSFLLLSIENTSVQFTLGGVVWFCGAIMSLSAVIALAVGLVHKAQAPNAEQDKRIENLEKAQEKTEQYLESDRKRLDSIEEGNKVIQRSLLALMSHAMNGNDVDKLKKSTESLQEYLIEK